MGKVANFLLSWVTTLAALGSICKMSFELYSLAGGEIGNLGQLFPVFIWLIAFIVFAFLAIFQREYQIRRLIGSVPKVTMVDVKSSFHSMSWFVRENESRLSYFGSTASIIETSQPIIKKENNEFFHVIFVNNRERKNGIRSAQRVVARVSYFNPTGERAINSDLDGRWDVPEPNSNNFSREPGDLLEVEIPANTRPRKLTIIVKPSGAPICYAYSHDWYNKQGINLGEFALPESRYYIRITLSGEDYWPDPYWLEMNIGERARNIELKPTNKPKWIKRTPPQLSPRRRRTERTNDTVTSQ